MSVRDHLEAIRAKHGYLDPDIVLMEATAKTHPLHDRFEWDNTIAGDAWRRDQAHRLIASVRVEYVTDDRPKSIRAYVAVPRPDSPRPVYEPAEEVLHDDLSRRILLSRMEREWCHLRARYGDMVEFAEMIKASLAA